MFNSSFAGTHIVRRIRYGSLAADHIDGIAGMETGFSVLQRISPSGHCFSLLTFDECNAVKRQCRPQNVLQMRNTGTHAPDCAESNAVAVAHGLPFGQ